MLMNVDPLSENSASRHPSSFGPGPLRGSGNERGDTVMSPNEGDPGGEWNGPTRWSVILSAVGVLVAIIALVVQIAQ
jgi:hypothetical protein